jgi:hypothetical protein
MPSTTSPRMAAGTGAQVRRRSNFVAVRRCLRRRGAAMSSPAAVERSTDVVVVSAVVSGVVFGDALRSDHRVAAKRQHLRGFCGFFPSPTKGR